jgi:hypothetical protein
MKSNINKIETEHIARMNDLEVLSSFVNAYVNGNASDKDVLKALDTCAQNKAASDSSKDRLKASVKYARANGVDESRIIHSVEELDAFMGF